MPKQLPPLHVLEEMLQRGQRKEVNDIIGMNLFPRVEQIVGSKDVREIDIEGAEHNGYSDQFRQLQDRGAVLTPERLSLLEREY